ncbi:MAG: S41 family peptidase [Pseudomonadota bacterium]
MKLKLLISGLAGMTIALATTPALAQEVNILRNPSLEELDARGLPVGWFSNANTGSGYEVEIDTQSQTDGAHSVKLFSNENPEAPFANLAQSIDASAYRGHRLRLTASVKTGTPASRHLGLWFRVDKADGTTGFFDNMRRRPISSLEWETYAIEGFVDPSATRITIGVIMAGEGEAWLDQVRLVDLGFQPLEAAAAKQRSEPRLTRLDGDLAAAPLHEEGKQNLMAFARLYGLVRWFHPSDAAINADWEAFAIASIPVVERASDAGELAQALHQAFVPLAATLQIAPGTPDDLNEAQKTQGPVWQWQHYGLGGTSRVYRSNRVRLENAEGATTLTEQLPGGVSFRLPLYTSVAEEGSGNARSDDARFAGKPDRWTPSGHDRTTRLASTIAAWTTLAHFYPYWDEVRVDWQTRLDETLSDAASAPDDKAFHLVLQSLVASIDDGHGWVGYPNNADAVLPIDWTTIGGELIVTAVADGVTGVEPGMIVTSIDGVTAEQALAEERRRMSGSVHYRQTMAEQFSRVGAKDEAVVLSVRKEAGPTSFVTLTMQDVVRSGQFQKVRPQTFVELAPGIFYIDLSRISQVDMDDALVRIADAQGLVFDLRGYPRINTEWLARLTDEPIRSAKFMRPELTGPDGQARYDEDGGWTIAPIETRLTQNVVFLTNASAISYAESVLGTVKANGLGTIVGSPTAGANGNVSEVSLPGGYTLRYTGMKVLNRDGSQHHLIGVTPDIAVSPTREGVAVGKDEVLEAGVDLVIARARQAKQS